MKKRGPRENGEIEQLNKQKAITRHAPGFAGHVKTNFRKIKLILDLDNWHQK